MISLDKQIELLAQLSVQYQERLESQDENWKIFFNQNNVGVPMATLIYLKMVEFPSDRKLRLQSEMLIRKSFFNLCDAMNLERGRKHLSIDDMFRNSSNPTIAEFDEETLEEIDALRKSGVL